MAKLPDKVRKGEMPKAAWANELIDFLAASLNIKGGRGIDVKVDADAKWISLAKPNNPFIHKVKITASPDTGAENDIEPHLCKYSYSYGDGEVTNRLPDIRLVDSARVIPAEVGDVALVFRVLDQNGELSTLFWPFTERTATFVCAGAARDGAGGGGGESKFEALVEAVAVRLAERGIRVG